MTKCQEPHNVIHEGKYAPKVGGCFFTVVGRKRVTRFQKHVALLIH